jgi:signal-transduction protein with cAMP-binding, CBS, and nucleotidyltransferase domain
MPLKDICKTNVVCISPSATVYEAARLMKDKHVGELIVTKSGGMGAPPLGILTDRDLVTRVLAKGRVPSEMHVEDVMAQNILSVHSSEGIYEATKAMERACIRRLPVVDAKGNIEGLVCLDDLYKLLALELNNLTRISGRQVVREGRVPRVQRLVGIN